MAAGEGDAWPIRIQAILNQNISGIVINHAHVGKNCVF
jgi:hypothetical protein